MSKRLTSPSRFVFFKTVMRYLDAPVATMLTMLVQDSRFSFSPYFNVLLVGGLGVFFTGLYRLATRKYGFVVAIWRTASFALSGYVLVFWALYSSGLSGILMEVVLITSSIGLAASMRKTIKKNYGKLRVWAFAAIILSALFPSLVFAGTLEKPELVVSPSTGFVSLSIPGSSRELSIVIGSVYANSWDIELSAAAGGADTLLVVFINNTLAGPVELPFVERGRRDRSSSQDRILSSNQKRDI